MASMNLNQTFKEYDLAGRITDEFISMYGIPVWYIITEQVNIDTVLNEFQYKKTSPNTYWQNIYAYPENTESFDGNSLLSKFGMSSLESWSLFVSYNTLYSIYADVDLGKAVGDIIALESGKLLEITNVEFNVPGLNNMFNTQFQKNLFKLSCKSYYRNNDNITSPEPIDIPDFSKIFNVPDFNINETSAQISQDDRVKGLDPIFAGLGV